MALYKPLYPKEGGPLGGFQCNYESSCHAVTRTEKGIRMHLAVCHGVRFQSELFNSDPDPSKAKDLPALPGIRP